MKHLIIVNLKALKRFFKELPEHLRCIFAAVLNKQARHEMSTLGVSFKCEPREVKSSHGSIKVISPANGHYMTTFFDVTPLSPNKKMLCLTSVPFISRIPIKGDVAEICIVDLKSSESIVVYRTEGWGSQLGANVQWYDDDNVLCNDVINGVVKGIKVNINTLKTQILDGPIFGLTPDRKYSYSGNLELINALIPGYGVPDNLFFKVRQKEKKSDSEGIWRTDLRTGKSELFLSINDIVSKLPESELVDDGTYYVFNTKVSPDNKKLFSVLFTTKIPFRAGWALQLVTCDIDGSNIKLSVPDRLWSKGGHHPNWSPSSEQILMNLRYTSKVMQFIKIEPKSGDIEALPGGFKGSGHPSFDKNGKFILTDAYASEGFSNSEKHVPIRLIDVQKSKEYEICRIDTKNITGPRRIDPHPVWIDEDRFVFNGTVNGNRQVFLADISDITRYE